MVGRDRDLMEALVPNRGKHEHKVVIDAAEFKEATV